MRPTKFWTGTITLAGAAVCALVLFVSAPAIVGGRAVDPPQSPPPAVAPTQTYEGMITDTHCQAKHSAIIGMTAADCTRVCVHGGDHFALAKGDAIYTLEGDQAALKKLAGQRVKIVGTLNGTRISVGSVSPE